MPSISFPIAKSPPTHLKRTDSKAGAVWSESSSPALHKADNKFYGLAAYSVVYGLILSHDCELDKPRNTKRILVAPVAELVTLDQETQMRVRHQELLALMPLPKVPSVGDCFADLRLITAIPRDLLNLNNRIASMTDPARARLHAQIAAFFFLREIPKASDA